MSNLTAGVINLPCPRNLTSKWGLGRGLGLCLTLQIVTGVVLAINYKADVGRAFEVVNRIVCDVNSG